MQDENSTFDEVVQKPVTLPDGTVISKPGPVVIVGPNGSGKTRLSREISAPSGDLEVVSALRNTKIARELQPMSLQKSRVRYESQKTQAKQQAYEPSNDFDFMLTALIGEAAEVSLDYLSRARKGQAPRLPDRTTLEEIQDLWQEFFPGRELTFREYLPQVTNLNGPGGQATTYSAWQMSDGEKAALYLAGRALTAPRDAVLVVDEPETHLHSLLAIRLWDAIQDARPKLRLIYATHDMTFAASRQPAHFLLANPERGLSSIELSDDVGELASVMLGASTLSFYARKIVFCEGDSDGLDHRLYSAWYDSRDTVVQAVGGSNTVVKCVQVLSSSNIVANLEVAGIVDRDYRSDANLSAMPRGVGVLDVHEAEALVCLPEVVAHVAKHLGIADFDVSAYSQAIIDNYRNDEFIRDNVALERWKVRVEGELVGLVARVTATQGVERLSVAIGDAFNCANWDFSPSEVLQEECERVDGVCRAEPAQISDVLRLMPGKQLRPLAAGALDIRYSRLETLVLRALKRSDGQLAELGANIRKRYGSVYSLERSHRSLWPVLSAAGR